MAVLEIKQNGSRRCFEMTKPRIIIGRAAESDIVLDDEKCSRRHCQLDAEDGHVVLHDLDSRNGTWQNSSRIERATLSDGDEFRIGCTRFQIHTDPTVDECEAVGESSPDAGPPIPVELPIADLPSADYATPAPVPALPRKAPRDRDWLELHFFINSLMKTGAVILIVGVAVGLWLWRGYSEDRAALARKAAEQQRIIQTTEGAENNVRQLVALARFQEARERVIIWQHQGLPDAEVTRLLNDIDVAAREKGRTALEAGFAAVDGGNIGGAQEHLEYCRSLWDFGFRDHRMSALETSIADRRRDLESQRVALEQQRQNEAAKNEIRTLLALLEDGQYEQVMVRRDSVLQHLENPAERDLVEKQIRDKVGARVQFLGIPAEAKVMIHGHEDLAVKGPEIIYGLPDGPLSATVQYEGYLPETVETVIAYPGLTEVKLSMLKLAPAHLWAAHSFGGRKGAALIAYHYQKNLHNAASMEFLAIFPAAEQLLSGAGKESLTDVELKRAIEKALNRSPNDLAAIERLAELAAQDRHSLQLVYAAAKPLIARMADRAENGCFDCLGLGKVTCSACGGQTRGVYLKKCNGKSCVDGFVRCPLCHSNPGWKKCEACSGTGYQGAGAHRVRCPVCFRYEHQLKEDSRTDGRARGKGEAETITDRGKGKIRGKGGDFEGHVEGSSTSELRASMGLGFVPCGCDHGKRPCPLCHGKGQREAHGKCESCEGVGLMRCPTCGGKASRNSMQRDRRREKEGELSRRCLEHAM